MELLIQAILLVIGFGLLIKGADFFVDGASGLAKKFGIPELIIGLTIVAMGTSAPEAAVSITGAFAGSADISIGNVLGSNILNVFVILGTAAAITPVAVGNSTVKIEMPFLILVSVLFLGLGYDGKISRTDGIILWAVFIVYLVYLLVSAGKQAKEKKETKENVETAKNSQPEEQPVKQRPMILTILMIAAGLVMIIGGSDVAVGAASKIARFFGMSERFIGLTIVALGTSLPELCTSVLAAKRGNADIAIGNVVGSNLFNILFVIGTSALIIPIKFAKNFIFDGIVAIAAVVLLFLCIVRKKKLSRLGGAVLLLSYVAYFIYIIR